MRRRIRQILNLDNADTKRLLLSAVGSLSGMYEVRLQPRRATRSLRANSFYWAACISPLSEFLSEQDVRLWTPEQCHELIKCRILGDVPIADPRTGEILGHKLASTHDMDTEQFADFLERVIAYLSSEYGIIVVDGARWRQTAGVA